MINNAVPTFISIVAYSRALQPPFANASHFGLPVCSSVGLNVPENKKELK